MWPIVPDCPRRAVVPLAGSCAAAEPAQVRGALEVKAAQFRVDGMYCSDCPARIEDLIRQLEGVKDARAYRQLRLASVLYDDTSVDTKTIQRRIQDAGFVASVH